MDIKFRSYPRSLFAGACLVALISVSAAFADGVRVCVIDELTADGQKITHPSPASPAYYVPVWAGYKELGRILARAPQPPPAAAIQRLVIKTLAGEGYLLATPLSPPTLAIVVSWGYAAPIMIPGKQLVNPGEMYKTIGIDGVEDMTFIDPREKELVDAGDHIRHYLILTAFDYQARQQHRVVELWSAHVTAPWLSGRLNGVLPTMLRSAAPYFGLGNPKPMFMTSVRQGRVVVGTPMVNATVSPAPTP